jgi:hypothetical protein
MDLYGQPDQELIASAEAILAAGEESPLTDDCGLGAIEARNLMQEQLDQYGLD